MTEEKKDSQEFFNMIMNLLIGACEHLGPFHPDPHINRIYIALRIAGCPLEKINDEIANIIKKTNE